LSLVSMYIYAQVPLRPTQYLPIGVENEPTAVCDLKKWVIDSAKAVWSSKLAFHALLHCILLTAYSNIVLYPVSQKEVLIFDLEIVQRPENLCGGVLTNLYVLAAINSGCYLVGSVLYRLFVISARPKIFYRWWYPLLAGSLMAVTILLWYGRIPTFLTLGLVGLSTIVPYYLTYYDYYLFTTETPEPAYGFVLGLYNTINTVLTALIQAVFLTSIPFWAVLGGCCAILIGCIVYSVWISALCARARAPAGSSIP
jgi:hypothetical protein